MYKYSKGINLVAGGEKHRVYVKKSPTGVGKGVKGHVMVNHPTEDKGKWDTIDLTEKVGAKTVQDGKNATKKWHAENPYMYGAKSVKQYRGDENLPEAKNGMKNCGCKHPKKKYKYGTGAVVIPEGSAIVTANGGKNKQALRAYKQGNYKLLNRIIDGMPEDRVDKAQKGKKTTPAKEQWTGGNQKFSYTAQTPGRLDYQPDRFGNPIWSQANYPTWKQKVSEGIQDSERYKKILNYLKNYAGADNEDVRKILAEQDPDKLKDKILKLGTDEKVGPFHVALEQAFNETEEIPEDIPEDIPGDTPGKQTITEIPEKKPISPYKYKPNFNNFPSLAEVAARSSVLGQGVEGVPENYLKLDRYNYASQLPKTLREIQLAEQGGRETARDMVAGDAGRYLAQSGNLSAARMKASNDAVIQDTLARQDILNKNVDLGNLEAQTNTGLKNEYAMQRAANRGAFNNQLISLGQSIDTAADTSKVMGAQMKNDAQRLEMLKSMAESGNYNVVTNPDGTIRYEAAKKGFKKVKTYKRR